jgi:integrase
MRGSIRKRGAGSHEIQLELERIHGKRRRRFIAIKGTYRAAQKELTRLLGAADDGTLADTTRLTVGEYLRQWLASDTSRSPKTRERYLELAERQVIPHLGDVKLQVLKPEHLEHWHAALLATDISARTVGHAHRVLSACLRRAVENGTITRNVAAIRKPPKVEERELEILTPDQVSIVLEALKGHSLHPIASLALATGMRRGELLALQWSDIDLNSGTIRVERSVEETGAGLRIKPPKTKRGRRAITLSADAVGMLREHRLQQMEFRLQLGQGGKPTLVFSDVNGNMLYPDALSRQWANVIRAKKLPLVSFHSLRHTSASMMIAAGVDILTVSRRRLGHSKAATTLDVYSHLLPGSDAAAAKALEGMLK